MNYDILIIGAGIVGLATGQQIVTQQPELKIAILDKEAEIAKHQTGNNSGVIHSGIYYTPGSLKAKNCRRGYKMLLDFCEKNEVKYELCGKVIVATKDEELPALENIFQRGNQNRLDGIRRLKPEEVSEIEPHVYGVAGIRVPQTGIIDYKEVSNKYAEVIKAKGGDFFMEQKVLDIKLSSSTATVVTNKTSFETKLVINCAGLYSDKITKMTMPEVDIQIIPFRGEYYEVRKEKQYLVNHLIYPVPNPNFPFLGVHFTRMIHGGIEAGPNAVLAFAREGYKKSKIHLPEFFETLTHPGFRKIAGKFWKYGMGEMYRSFSKTAFVKALQNLIPEINSADLKTGEAGVRAQACDSKGNLSDDFLIFEKEHIINVCNAPSPAATASLAIGESLAQKALTRL